VKTTARVLSVLIGITGLIQLVLGLVLWTGRAKQMIPFHMLIGIVFVLLIWVLCVVGFRARLAGPSALNLIWSLLVIGLGMAQMQLMVGPSHWVIRVAHLLIGVAAMAFAGTLGAGIKRRADSGTSAAQPVAG
jgi:hypothetical protein